MTDTKQQVLNLRKEGLTKSEISRRLNVPRTTVRRWLENVEGVQDTSEKLKDVYKRMPAEFEVVYNGKVLLVRDFSRNMYLTLRTRRLIPKVEATLVPTQQPEGSPEAESGVGSETFEDVPLSEVAIPKINHCTAEEAIEDLRALAIANPERALSRNYYRVHGTYAESAYTKYFGTFYEFKRQAGIVLTRQQHNLEKQIAKHASVDHYRQMNKEIRGYGDAYDKPTDKRFKQAIFVSDLHDKNVDPFLLDVLIDTVKRVQPDVIILGGDVFDAPEFGRYAIDPREWDVVGRIKFVHENILAPLRSAAPYAQIDMIVGNHEQRLVKHLADNTQALRVVLSDLHGMSVGSLFGLDKYQVNFICKSDLAAYTLADQHKEVRKNYKVYWDSFLVSHEPYGKHLAMPGISGHQHKTCVHPLYNEIYGAYSWVEAPGGHKLDSCYSMSKWQNGFVIVTCDTENKRTVFDTVTMQENFAIVGGVYYQRKGF